MPHCLTVYTHSHNNNHDRNVEPICGIAMYGLLSRFIFQYNCTTWPNHRISPIGIWRRSPSTQLIDMGCIQARYRTEWNVLRDLITKTTKIVTFCLWIFNGKQNDTHTKTWSVAPLEWYDFDRHTCVRHDLWTAHFQSVNELWCHIQGNKSNIERNIHKRIELKAIHYVIYIGWMNWSFRMTNRSQVLSLIAVKTILNMI